MTPADAFDQYRRSLIDRQQREVPAKYRPLQLRVLHGTATPREAIKAMCLECLGWERNEVAHCTSMDCPNYLYRPFKAPVEDVAAYHCKKSGLQLPAHWPTKSEPAGPAGGE